MARNFVAASSQYLELTSAPVTATPLTIAAWFKRSAAGSGAIVAIDTNGGTQRYQLYTDVGGTVRFGSVGSGNFFASTTASYSTGVWQHACGIEASATDRRVFLNGANKGTDPNSTTTSGVDRFHIGARISTTLGFYFDGDIGEVAIWDVALTDDEVAALGKGISPLLIRPANIIGYWPLMGQNSPEIELVGRLEMTLGNSPTAATSHPPVERPTLDVAISPKSFSQTVSPSGIATAQAFGTLKVNRNIVTAGIVSQQAFGTTSVAKDGTITPAGLASAETFGQAAVLDAYDKEIVTTSGLDYYWPLSELSGTIAMDIKHSVQGLYLNTPSLNQPILFANGLGSRSVGFDHTAAEGVRTYVGDTNGYDPLQAFTCEFWFKPTNNPTSIGGGGGGPIGNNTWGMTWDHPDPAQRAKFWITVGGIGYSVFMSSPTGGKVYHIVATYDGETLRLYQNGVLVDSNTGPSGNMYGTSDIYIAGGQGDGFTGLIEKMALYTAVLDSTTVQNHYLLGQTVNMSGIASAQAFGTLKVNFTLPLTGIISQESFGLTTVRIVGFELPIGIPSQEAFGSPTLIYNQTISPSGIASAQAFGTARVPTNVIVPSIQSTEAFGTHTVALVRDSVVGERLRANLLDASGNQVGLGPILSIQEFSYTSVLDAIGSWSMKVPAGDRTTEEATTGRQIKVYQEEHGQILIGYIESNKLQPLEALNLSGPDVGIELMWTNTLFGLTYNNVSITTVLDELIALVGNGWTRGTTDGGMANVTRTFEGETVFEALVKLMRERNKHLRYNPATRVIDFGAFGEDTGTIFSEYTGDDPDLINTGSNPLILEMVPEIQTDEVWNWVVPVGGGHNPTQLNLRYTTRMSSIAYAPSTKDTNLAMGNVSGNTRRGQGFTPASARKLAFGRIYMQKVGSPSDTVLIDIANDDGTGKPGTVIATSEAIPASRFSTEYSLVPFTFTNPVSLSAAQYHFVVRRSGALNASNYYNVGADGSAPAFSGGAASVYNGTSWSATAHDLCFELSTNPDSGGQPYLVELTFGDDDREIYYLRDTTSITNFQRRQKPLAFTDISPISNNPADLALAADGLYDAAVTWLADHSVKREAYTLKAAGIHANTPAAGSKVRVAWRGYLKVDAEGYIYKDINTLLYVLQVTHNLSEDQHTHDLTVATVAEFTAQDQDVIIGELQRTKHNFELQTPVYQAPFNWVFADSLDATHPLTFPVEIDDSILIINRAAIRIRLKPIRSDFTGVAAGGGQTTSSGGGQTSSSGSSHSHSISGGTSGSGSSHTHSFNSFTVTEGATPASGFGWTGGQIAISGDHVHAYISGGADQHFHDFNNSLALNTESGHSHSVSGSTSGSESNHTHTVSNHSHTVSDHTHALSFGITEGGSPTNVTLTIDGTDRTTALGGPWNADVNLDITRYLSDVNDLAVQGVHTISIGSASIGRIEAIVKLVSTYATIVLSP